MRSTALRRIKLALAITIAAFAVAGAAISFAIVERQTALGQVSRYNITWAATQAFAELQHMENRVVAYGLPHGEEAKDEVLLRLDILFNRSNILRGGDFIAFLDANPEQRAVVDDFSAALLELERLVAEIDRPGTIERIRARLEPLGPKLARFAAAANQFSGQQVAEDQRHLFRLHWTFSAIAAGLVLCGLVFIGLLFFQNRVVQQAHQDLRTMADDLRVAKEAAEAASEAKSRFLATMSHELRTPLNAIIGFSEFMSQEGLGPLGHRKYREYLGDILKSGRHMYDLITDILTMAKLEGGPAELVLEPVCLRTLVETTVEIFRGTEIADQRSVTIEPGEDWPQLRADVRAVRQMLLNLLSNAAKFSATESPIRVACRRAASGDIELTVTDHGIGMTAAEAALAVQPFQQIDSRLARKYAGTGLGLSIVKALIERHNGRLEIESRPGAGSDISLVFPAELVDREVLANVA